jgi:2-polyprenyl-3-methyl-5-hydroxy-6-metoxy-1,4-benzoquinol methylase
MFSRSSRPGRSVFPTSGSLPVSDSHIIQSWHRNAAPWSTAVRDGQIASRTLVTDAAVLAAVQRQGGTTALDIGCGEGWLARALAAQGYRVTGVDVVPALIDAARAAHPEGDYRVASYESIAAGELDLEVDVAVANFSLIGRDAVEGLVRRVPALLALGGAFVVQTLHPATARGAHPYTDGWRDGSWAGFSPDFTDPPPWYFRTVSGWIAMLQAAGLRLREMAEPIHPVTGDPLSLILVADAPRPS